MCNRKTEEDYERLRYNIRFVGRYSNLGVPEWAAEVPSSQATKKDWKTARRQLRQNLKQY
jgi:hypothetical protein